MLFWLDNAESLAQESKDTKTLAIIDFSKEEKAQMVPLIQKYLSEQFDCDVGNLDAEFLLDFFSKEIGGYIYNRALVDVHALLDNQLPWKSQSLFYKA